MDRIFAPPKNSITKMTRKGVEIHVMDPEREIPNRVINEFSAKRKIVETLKEHGEMDVRVLFYSLLPEGWAEVYDVSPEEFTADRNAGIYVMNPYFELLESMVKDGILVESVDPRLEGGIEDVPRYSYRLA